MSPLDIFIIVFLSLFLLAQLATLWLTWLLRRLPAVRHRSISFTIVLVLMDTPVVFHELLPIPLIEVYPCVLNPWLAGVLLPMVATLWVCRFYRLAALYRRNEQELLRYNTVEQPDVVVLPREERPSSLASSSENGPGVSPDRGLLRPFDQEERAAAEDVTPERTCVEMTACRDSQPHSDSTHRKSSGSTPAVPSLWWEKNDSLSHHIGDTLTVRRRGFSIASSASAPGKYLSFVDRLLDRYKDQNVLWATGIIGVFMSIVAVLTMWLHPIYDTRPFSVCGIGVPDTLPIFIPMLLVTVLGGALIVVRVIRVHDTYGIRTELAVAVSVTSGMLIAAAIWHNRSGQAQPSNPSAPSRHRDFIISSLINGFGVALGHILSINWPIARISWRAWAYAGTFNTMEGRFLREKAADAGNSATSKANSKRAHGHKTLHTP
ncbi:hypothetical protein THASP1DRAFT_33100 [Thamnocephalis sphaerospora]|uniref:Uncharacterized protein n=1 Tax=Thamnocephalis sphaerospora TaxID=78915 RepID=A0A4P9XHD1_9FUNG|nr:hypothetical protein THASP1DRAFT_33100 [Thamnocephalis sphaerospora]|eukprot:RKP05073.1 hypothetical protein THASP1DRAFT_33100 [Thamnocephalis sphaerospora]